MRIAGMLAVVLVACSSSTPTAGDAQAPADVADGPSDASEVAVVDAPEVDAPRADVVVAVDAVDAPTPDLGELADVVDAGAGMDAVNDAPADTADAGIGEAGVPCDADGCALPGAAETTCSGGRCRALRCAPSRLNCDGNDFNGCEVDPRTDSQHCGICEQRCDLPQALTACVSSRCQITSCAADFADCDGMQFNGCEVDTRSNPQNCGRCGSACSARPHALPACAGGVCAISCVPGFGDCDGNASNGCETDTANDGANCGACGRACPAGQRCHNGILCELVCPSGQTLCAGACVDLQTDRDNCGRCGTRCGTGQACRAALCVSM